MFDDEKNDNVCNNPFAETDEHEEPVKDVNEAFEAIELEDEDEDEQTENSQAAEQIDEGSTSEKKAEIEQLEEKYNNLNNQYLRLAADFDNFRKRQAQERESLLAHGLEAAMLKIIEVLDNFDRAKKSMDNIENFEDLKKSFEVINNQMVENLKKLGLEEIQTQGQVFDPNLHEAVMKTPSEDHADETIIAELQKGYKLKDKVLRPALVNVAVKN